MKVLLCESNPMCYGSSAVLLSVLEKISVPSLCLVQAITKELIQKTEKPYIEVNNKSSEAVASVIESVDFDCVLVVSNTTNIALYKSLGKKVFFIHIHYFYPEAHKEILNLVDFLYIQRFWGNMSVAKGSTVGPLINHPDSKLDNKSNVILVNLGGGESQFIIPGVNSDYAEQMLNLLIPLKSEMERYRMVICGGEKALASIRSKANANGISVQSLSNYQYLHVLDHSAMLISSPGLSAIFEGLYRDKPMVFLPPQNISQVYQLSEYEKAGLCVAGLNAQLPDTAFNESELTEIFLRYMRDNYNDEKVKNEQLRLMRAQLNYIGTEIYRQAAKNAIHFLGAIGIDEIAVSIISHYDR